MALPSFGRHAYAHLGSAHRAGRCSCRVDCDYKYEPEWPKLAAGSCGCEAELLRMLKAYERRVAYGDVVHSCLQRYLASQLLLRFLFSKAAVAAISGFRWFGI